MASGSTRIFHYVPATYSSWEQNPEYIEACRTTPRAGDPTTYNPTHPAGATPTDVTSFKVGLARWNESNLPDIMYQLWPCEAWRAFKQSPKPGGRQDAQGNYIFEQHPRNGEAPRLILDFPILRGIDQISTEVPWWFLEILFRLDPRLEWQHIDMLMDNVGKRANQPNKAKFINARNNVCSRGRQDFFMVSWREKSKGQKGNQARDSVLERLGPTRLSHNTTRGVTPGPDGNGNVIPISNAPRPRRAATTTGTINQSQTSTPNTANGPSSHPRARRLGQRLAQITQTNNHDGHGGDRNEDTDDDSEDNDDDDDDDVDNIPQSAPMPKRKRARADPSDGHESENLDISDLGPSGMGRSSSSNVTRSELHRAKRQKVVDHLDLRNHPEPFPQSAGARPSSNPARRNLHIPKYVQRHSNRQSYLMAPRSTSAALANPSPNVYPSQVAHSNDINPNHRYASPDGISQIQSQAGAIRGTMPDGTVVNGNVTARHDQGQSQGLALSNHAMSVPEHRSNQAGQDNNNRVPSSSKRLPYTSASIDHEGRRVPLKYHQPLYRKIQSAPVSGRASYINDLDLPNSERPSQQQPSSNDIASCGERPVETLATESIESRSSPTTLEDDPTLLPPDTEHDLTQETLVAISPTPNTAAPGLSSSEAPGPEPDWDDFLDFGADRESPEHNELDEEL